jgi:iron complex outermembrane receptor protein
LNDASLDAAPASRTLADHTNTIDSTRPPSATPRPQRQGSRVQNNEEYVFMLRSSWFSGLPRRAGLALIAALSVWCLVPALLQAAPGDDPVPVWQKRLAALEQRLKALPENEPVAQEALAEDIQQLRQDMTDWLSGFQPAMTNVSEWIEAASTDDVQTGVEELAAEIGRLRATITRVSAALKENGDGAFYLGRVDVSVSAETSTTATTEMTPAGSTVIDARDLRMADRSTLDTALSMAPGVAFSRVGQRNETGIYLRGFDMRQVPLFIDGIPIYTPYDGYVDMGRFTTFDVSEIRVTKGFTSVLYGSNALGGAVNIVSRRPANRLEGIVGATYGIGPAKTGFLNAGSRLGNSFYVQGGGSYVDVDTFPLSNDFHATKDQEAGDRTNAYHTDKHFNVKFGWTPNGTDEYAVSYVGQRSEKGNPPYAGSDSAVKVRYWQWPYWDKDSVYFVSNTKLGATSYMRVRAFNDVYDNSLYSYDNDTYSTQKKASSFRSRYHDTTYGGSVEYGTAMGRHMIRAAGHYKSDNHKDHNDGEIEKRFDGAIMSIGVEDTFQVSNTTTVIGGVSLDRQTTSKATGLENGASVDLLEDCGGCGTANGLNPQVGIFFAVPTGQARLTVSRKTRMPSLKDRYSYKFGTAIPNPNLNPEHNVTFEAGYQGVVAPRTTFQGSAFYSRIDDLIQSFYLAPNLSQMRNIGQATHMGVEADIRTKILPRLDLSANYTFLHRKNNSNDTPLVGTPKHKGRASLIATPFPFLQLVASVDYEVGRRAQNEAGNYHNIDSFYTGDAKAVFTLFKNIDAEFAVYNVLDRNYWVTDGYPEAGRTMAGTVRYRF